MFALAALSALYSGLARRRILTWGATDAEGVARLPGDELLEDADGVSTRAIWIDAPAAVVWPWLAQMGYGRGGWYTPAWVDLIANRWIFGQRRRSPSSAGQIRHEYQHVAVGDLICDGPDYASYFRVQRVDPPHALVYRSLRHPRRGSPIDISDPASPARVERQLRDAGTYVDFTWALVLNPLPRHRSRLLVRTRAMYAPASVRWLSMPLGLFDATYGRAMLRAIADRAECHASSNRG